MHPYCLLVDRGLIAIGKRPRTVIYGAASAARALAPSLFPTGEFTVSIVLGTNGRDRVSHSPGVQRRCGAYLLTVVIRFDRAGDADENEDCEPIFSLSKVSIQKFKGYYVTSIKFFNFMIKKSRTYIRAHI